MLLTTHGSKAAFIVEYEDFMIVRLRIISVL